MSDTDFHYQYAWQVFVLDYASDEYKCQVVEMLILTYSDVYL